MNTETFICWIVFTIVIASIGFMISGHTHKESIDLDKQKTAWFCIYTGIILAIIAVILLFIACLLV